METLFEAFLPMKVGPEVITWKKHLPKTRGHSNVVLSVISNEHQNVLLVSHQQKCSINRICGNFEIKSNYFGSVISEE